MGASRFYRDHARLMRPGDADDHAARVAEAYEAVRDLWIAQGRYEDLVRAITANWTSGNCVDYMAPLTDALIAAGEFDLHRHLWTRTIKRQVETFFHVLGRAGSPPPAYLRLRNLDTAGFVDTDPAAYRRPERAAAFLLQRLSRDLARWRDELRSVGQPTDVPDAVERSLQALRRPRITVPRLPSRSARPGGETPA